MYQHEAQRKHKTTFSRKRNCSMCIGTIVKVACP